MGRPIKIQWPIGFWEMLRFVFPYKRLEDARAFTACIFVIICTREPPSRQLQRKLRRLGILIPNAYSKNQKLSKHGYGPTWPGTDGGAKTSKNGPGKWQLPVGQKMGAETEN